MESIRQLLEVKGHEVWTVRPDDHVFEAIRVMAEKGVGALLVCDGKRLAGIVSERDYARKVILVGKSSKSTQVKDFMTTDPVTVTPGESVDDCLSIMTTRHFRHLPVVDGDEVVGVLSLGDLVRSIIDDQKHLINSLEQYIAG